MYNISGTKDLKEAVGLLEREVDEQKQLLSEQLSVIYESFAPANIIKEVFNEVVTSEEFRSNILTATVGISTGYLTKKLIFKKNSNAFKMLSGNLLQYAVANLIVNPARVMKTVILPLLGFFSTSHKQ